MEAFSNFYDMADNWKTVQRCSGTRNSQSIPKFRSVEVWCMEVHVCLNVKNGLTPIQQKKCIHTQTKTLQECLGPEILLINTGNQNHSVERSIKFSQTVI